jgi:citrate synthase
MFPVQTAISQVFSDRILVRGYSLTAMAGTYSFGDVVYLLMTGELPLGQEGEMIEAILVACVEHSINAPSTHTARAVANTGAPLQTAVAAGVSAIGEHHGGAGEACARLLQETIQAHPTATPDELAARVTADFRQRGQRLPGFGHRFHDPDPRAQQLLALADAKGISSVHVALARAMVTALHEATGRSLPLNVDGALAALLSDMGIGWRYGKALFIIGRTAGLAAHACEEQMTGKPFQFAARVEAEYIGPVERPLPPRPSETV